MFSQKRKKYESVAPVGWNRSVNGTREQHSSEGFEWGEGCLWFAWKALRVLHAAFLHSFLIVEIIVPSKQRLIYDGRKKIDGFMLALLACTRLVCAARLTPWAFQYGSSTMNSDIYFDDLRLHAEYYCQDLISANIKTDKYGLKLLSAVLHSRNIEFHTIIQTRAKM